MGMMDKPQYLTGDGGYVSPGDEFYLHNAKQEGNVEINGRVREQVKLLVSRDGNPGSTEVVFTSGAGIVGQIARIDASDRDRMSRGWKVRLDAIPSGKGNPTNVLTDADQEPPSEAPAGSDQPDF